MGMLTDRSREVDVDYDMYSFGVLLGQMVTKEKLYPANPNLVIQRSVSHHLMPPSVLGYYVKILWFVRDFCR